MKSFPKEQHIFLVKTKPTTTKNKQTNPTTCDMGEPLNKYGFKVKRIKGRINYKYSFWYHKLLKKGTITCCPDSGQVGQVFSAFFIARKTWITFN